MEKIVKPYEDFTADEREQSQQIWVEVLDTFCKADEDGCRPCDRGCPCDRCHYDYDLQKRYVETLVERGVPITPGNEEYLGGSI